MDAVNIEPKLLVQDAISLVRPVHVLVDHAYGHDEVNIEVVDHIHDHAQRNNQARVFEVGQLDVHRSKLHSPADY